MTISTSIMELFGQSPITPLEEHMDKVARCVKLLAPFMQAVRAGEWDKARELRDSIATIEREADNLKRELRLHLPKSLFMPIARTDLLEMITMQDRIANKTKDIAGIVLGRRMSLPESVWPRYEELMSVSMQTVGKAAEAIQELEQLLEAGFRGIEVKRVEEMIVDVDRLEHDSDDCQSQVYNAIFAIESELAPIDVVFLYRLVEWTGDIADKAQNVSGQLNVMIAR